MHILLMLTGMIIGLSLGTNVHWLLGLIVMAGSLMFWNMGSKAWREKQEGFLLVVGLGCGALVLLYSIFN
ncbi:hypothetical protein [Pseudoalteromonas tetraodonis]|uniref:hypothetical protein n=1 Tax=Pseudoalteromonas tetraodonis TaxID=43659 RepID=UPI003A979336